MMQRMFCSLLACTVLLAWVLTAAEGSAGTIYKYEDENGCLHFTDLPVSDKYRPFLVFRNHPEVGFEELLRLVKKYSRLYDMDEHLVQAVVQVESAFKPTAVSHAGAQGLMQIMPGTQKDLGLLEPFDPDCNIEAGVRYLKQMVSRFGNVVHALAAYNAGPSQVVRYKGVPPFPETQQYVKKVIALYENLKIRQ